MDSYFDYAKTNSRICGIKRVCSRFTMVTYLQDSIKKEWGDYTIVNDANLLRVIYKTLKEKRLESYCKRNKDANKLYDRCNENIKKLKNSLRNGDGIDYDRLFDVLFDVTWLLVSFENSKKEKLRFVSLINPSKVMTSSKFYLDKLYQNAVELHSQSKCIEDVLVAKRNHPFATALGLIEISSRYSRHYLSWSIQELEYEKDECELECQNMLVLYYNITITMVWADKIRRTL